MFLENCKIYRKTLCARVSFSIKFQASGLQLYYKRDPDTGVFLWILRNFEEHLFLQNTSGGCFYNFAGFTSKFRCLSRTYLCLVVSASYLFVRCRSSRLRYSVKKGVLRKFAKLKGKQLRQSLFSKVEGLRPATSLKKRLWHMCFPVNFAKFSTTIFL